MVRAQRGERHAYRPIVSRLCRSSEPLSVVKALMELYPFTRLYIADLDAIQERGQHIEVVASIRAAFPELEIWLDAGINHTSQWQPWQAMELHCVIGSESQQDEEHARQLIDRLGQEHAVLSLDIGADGQRGPASLFENCNAWPEKVIAMTLLRVGSHQGPDWTTLKNLTSQARQTYAAGGIRDITDLQELKIKGIAGALIASALHDGKITAEDLLQL